jgi:hypothetical protein
MMAVGMSAAWAQGNRLEVVKARHQLLCGALVQKLLASRIEVHH